MAQENLDTSVSTNPTTKTLPAGLSIWPPTQRTREAVVRRLVDTLTAPTSALSKRFGPVPSSDAEMVASAIEKEAIAAVSADASTESVEEGIKALQLYSKEVSDRLMGFSKSRVPKERDDKSLKKGDNEESGEKKGDEEESGEKKGDEEESGEKKDEEDAGSVVNSEATSA